MDDSRLLFISDRIRRINFIVIRKRDAQTLTHLRIFSESTNDYFIYRKIEYQLFDFWKVGWQN